MSSTNFKEIKDLSTFVETALNAKIEFIFFVIGNF